ncbi:MAG: DUF1080 domain-containing protein [Candidatus Marinimicrobia bacterium]|nr:DUF1080 domain-containing protein [Candidatus Neomarinimicrobiota bacterium]
MFDKMMVVAAPLVGMLALFSSCAQAPVPELSVTHHPTIDISEGWQDLFASDLSNAFYAPDSWTLAEGVLSREGGGDIWTREQYGDFVLDLEFKLAENTNSGVFIRTGDIEHFVHTAIEVQIHASTDGTPHGMCGAIYDCLSPSMNRVRKAGEWNRYTITAQANKIFVVFNGEQIINMDLNRWTEAHMNPDGSPNKFNTAYKDMPRVGHIGFQDHGQPIWYRNIKIKKLGG